MKMMFLNINLMMFATNAEPATERPIDGILGIAPCPSELAEYSFAAQLIKHYKHKKFDD